MLWNTAKHASLRLTRCIADLVSLSFQQTWDDWFRIQTEDHSFQDVIDTLLNSAIFLYIGSILPWSEFGGGFFGIQPWRLVVLGIAVMILRRLPWVVALVRRNWRI